MLNFKTKIEKTAKSANEAKEMALLELGLSEEDVNITVIDEGTKGFLGLGSKEAKIIAEVKEPAPCKAKMFLTQVFNDMNLDVNISTKLDGDNMTVDLSGDNMGIIIGKRGDTLDSLQYLTSLVVNRNSEDYVKITLDTENYREKRNSALVALAERLAEKVLKTGKKYTLEPMNPYERRIIHSSLQGNDKITTFSVGEDPYRKVVIAPKNPVKPSYYKRTPSQSYNPPRKYPEHASYENFESYSKDNSSTEDED